MLVENSLLKAEKEETKKKRKQKTSAGMQKFATCLRFNEFHLMFFLLFLFSFTFLLVLHYLHTFFFSLGNVSLSCQDLNILHILEWAFTRLIICREDKWIKWKISTIFSNLCGHMKFNTNSLFLSSKLSLFSNNISKLISWY